MARTVSIGRQDFEKMRLRNNFYIDKTHFIREWWNADDDVTLITRPRRFGKTLNMNMLEKFFSTEYAGRSELFEGLSIWEDESFRSLQGTYPVIFLSFAAVKETSFIQARKAICHIIAELYNRWEKLPFLSSSYPAISAGIMEKMSSFFWMNMTRRCRRPMCKDTGRNWLNSPGAFSMPPLKPTPI